MLLDKQHLTQYLIEGDRHLPFKSSISEMQSLIKCWFFAKAKFTSWHFAGTLPDLIKGFLVKVPTFLALTISMQKVWILR